VRGSVWCGLEEGLGLMDWLELGRFEMRVGEL